MTESDTGPSRGAGGREPDPGDGHLRFCADRGERLRPFWERMDVAADPIDTDLDRAADALAQRRGEVRLRLRPPRDMTEDEYPSEVTEALALTVSFDLRYDSGPPDGISSLDTSLRTGVTYTY